MSEVAINWSDVSLVLQVLVVQLHSLALFVGVHTGAQR